MSDRILFGSMSPEAKVFYSRIVNTAILNMYAVRNGLFDTFLCESDDPLVMIRWREAVPRVVAHIEARRQQAKPE